MCDCPKPRACISAVALVAVGHTCVADCRGYLLSEQSQFLTFTDTYLTSCLISKNQVNSIDFGIYNVFWIYL